MSSSKSISKNISKSETATEVVANAVNKSLSGFHERIIKLQSPDFPDEEYLEVDLYDYFERLNRQGWSCSKVKKIGGDR